MVNVTNTDQYHWCNAFLASSIAQQGLWWTSHLLINSTDAIFFFRYRTAWVVVNIALADQFHRCNAFLLQISALCERWWLALNEKHHWNNAFYASWMSMLWIVVNTFRPRQNGHEFADHIFKLIFFDEIFCILIEIWLKVVPRNLTDNKWALVQTTAWHQTGGKP